MSSRLLLDTHVLVWAVAAPHRILRRTMAQLADMDSALFVSAASAFEIATKVRLGRMPDAAEIARTYGSSLARIGATKLDVSAEHALLAGALDWAHADPFDRLLVAQAELGSLTLVTKDRAIREFDGVRTLWR